MESWLEATIKSIKKLDAPSIVAVCGAADLGKSHISQNIVSELLTQGIEAAHLTLDSYLLDRSERLLRGISGYHIDAYNQKSVLGALTQFKNSQPIKFYPYDHIAGAKSKTLTMLEVSSVLILDGVQSMHECFASYTDLSIFVYTQDHALKTIRLDADLEKRKYSIEFAKSNSEPEFLEYKAQIEPYKVRADIKLFMERQWRYQIHT